MTFNHENIEKWNGKYLGIYLDRTKYNTNIILFIIIKRKVESHRCRGEVAEIKGTSW